MEDELTMSADEFFGVTKLGKAAPRAARSSKQLTRKALFDRVKVRMVMRIYGVSCADAVGIIAEHAQARVAADRERMMQAFEKSRRAPLAMMQGAGGNGRAAQLELFS